MAKETINSRKNKEKKLREIKDIILEIRKDPQSMKKIRETFLSH